MSTFTQFEGLQTGDIILFSGRCKMSRFVQLLMLGKWSHVGMVVIDPNYDYPLLYESTHSQQLRGLDIGRRTQGVQLVPLHKRIKSYKGDIAVRQLHGVEFNADDHFMLDEIRSEMVGRPFESDLKQFLKAQFRYKFYTQKEDLSTIFCSELIAHVYQVLGVLNGDAPSNCYTPMDFSARTDLRLTRGYLGREILLKKFKKHLFRK